MVPFLWSSAFVSTCLGPGRSRDQLSLSSYQGLKSICSEHFRLWFMWSLGLFLRISASVAATFDFLAAFMWIGCSLAIIFLFPTCVLLAVLTGKPVFICASFGCEREREVLETGSLCSPKFSALLCSAIPWWDPLLPSECGMEGSVGMISALGLNFLALICFFYWVFNLSEKAGPLIPSCLNGL